jgi:hypothetical protein
MIPEEDYEEEISLWIRVNVPKKKVTVVKKLLKGYDNYLQHDTSLGMPDRVYRALKGSYKLNRCYYDAVNFMDLLTYLMLPEKETPRMVDGDNLCYIEKELESVEDDIRACFIEDSITMRFYNRMMKSKKDIVKRFEGKWLDYSKVTLEILGGAIMFYYYLISFLRIAENCHMDKDYKIPMPFNSFDGITYNYIFSDKKGGPRHYDKKYPPETFKHVKEETN